MDVFWNSIMVYIALCLNPIHYFFNDTRCFDVSFADLCFHIIIACSAAHSENKGKYHQHVEPSGTNRSA